VPFVFPIDVTLMLCPSRCGHVNEAPHDENQVFVPISIACRRVISAQVNAPSKFGSGGMRKGICLICPYYRGATVERQREIETCLKRNSENEHIYRIDVFVDKIDELPVFESDKVCVRKFPEQMSFTQSFRFAQANCLEDICIIANADIYFDHTLAKLYYVDLREKLLALTSYNDPAEHGFATFDVQSAPCSHDAWIFYGSLLQLHRMDLDIPVGANGCTGRLTQEFLKSGYRVGNPCYDIIAHHLHNSEHPRKVRGPGPFIPVPPCML
jgi:hypothetical protein